MDPGVFHAVPLVKAAGYAGESPQAANLFVIFPFMVYPWRFEIHGPRPPGEMQMSKMMRLSLLLSFLVLPLQAGAETSVTRLADNQSVTMGQLADRAATADLVLIGEVHNNPAVHDLQLSVIRGMHAKEVPLAIGVEVMQPDSQKQLDDWTSGKLGEEEFKAVFARNWSYGWGLYREIFVYARDNKIPIIAVNVPKEIAVKVSRKGCGTLTGEEMQKLPRGTNCDLDNPHTEFLKESFQGLFNSVTNGRVFEYFCQAQTLRNSAMAMSIAQYARDNPGRKIVVLAGIWHAVKNAIPEQLKRNGSKMTSIVIMPQIPEFSGGKASPDVIDYLVKLPSP